MMRTDFPCLESRFLILRQNRIIDYGNLEMAEKNKVYEIEITAISSDGNGIGRLDGMAVFVPYTAVGDIVRARIVKLKKSYAAACAEEIIKPSKYRKEAECSVYERCGGCRLMHMEYEAQIEAKRNSIESALERIGGFKGLRLEKMNGMEDPFHYRNKAVFHVSGQGNNTVCGFYAAKSHENIPAQDCVICSEINPKIIDAVREYIKKYNLDAKSKGNGSIEQIFTRTAFNTGETMVVISIGKTGVPDKEELVDMIRNAENSVLSVILDNGKERTVFGSNVITDYIGGIKFEISADSFFQVNPVMTQRLYKTAIEYAAVDRDTSIMDIYCGIGTISLCAAKKAKRVIGIEAVGQAVEDARKNALANGICNAEFYAGRAEDIVPELIKSGERPDVVILDPPRKGSDKATLDAIVEAAPERVVYVSCDPATLARDMKYLRKNGYVPKKARGFDMFPHTVHVETVVLMSQVKD